MEREKEREREESEETEKERERELKADNDIDTFYFRKISSNFLFMAIPWPPHFKTMMEKLRLACPPLHHPEFAQSLDRHYVQQRPLPFNFSGRKVSRRKKAR